MKEIIVDMNLSLENADRREAFCKNAPNCPMCDSGQVQLVSWINSKRINEADWKCRECECEWTEKLFMKPSEKCKEAGLKSLDELSKLTGESTQTLRNWHKSRPVAFETLLYGAVVKKLFEITKGK